MLHGVSVSNGIGWSLDETLMYYVDTPTLAIDVFDYDTESGAIENRRTFAAIEEGGGMPDGLIVDAEGCIWVALWEGFAVRRVLAPDATLTGVVEVPASRVTNLGIRRAGLDELYITTARGPEPESGGVFRVETGARGLPAHAFGG